MNLQPDKAPEARNTTWAGEHGEHLRSFQSPEELFLLTLPFIERACVDWPGHLPGGRLRGSHPRSIPAGK